jgi:choline dehydrogenase-like flavoprotein
VIVAASAIETARLLLLSKTPKHPDGLGNRSGQLGRNLMFHHFTQAAAVFTEKVHAWRGPSTTVTIDDFVGPNKGSAAKAAGLPYLKGGICEVGGTLTLLAEAKAYGALADGWGRKHKDMMRAALVRDHVAGLTMVGEDLPQLANRVDLDPAIRDVHGFPAPRITYSPHRFEEAAAAYYGAELQAICQAAPGATGSFGGFGDGPTRHVLGTARMGRSAERSVVDGFGRVHDIEDLVIADGSVFVSSGGFNPSLTIMALALRSARRLR